jgi:hypothetical protein
MTRGRPLGVLLTALGLFVAGVGVLAVREHLSPLLLSVLVVADLAAVGYLVVFAWRKRGRSR